jgi:hypothetical protein
MYSSKEKYRATQLDSLRAKVTEEERLNEIDRQIYNLHNLKQVRLSSVYENFFFLLSV